MTYSDIAPYYDSLMSHVNYKEWLDLIKHVIKKFHSQQKVSILEIGAGTGSLGKLLLNSGFEYQASDYSYAMSKLAKKKGMSIFCSDICHLPIKKKYQMILFLYDAINYLTSLNDYKKAFLSVASVLDKNGLFLFDITTKTNSIRYFYDHTTYDEIDHVSLIRHSYYLPVKCLQCNDFTIFIPQKENTSLYLKRTEEHRQKLFDPVEIKQVIPHHLFTCLGIWDGFSQNRFNKQSERVHFLLQRL